MNDLKNKLIQISKYLLRIRVQIFILVLVLVYGFIVLRINALSNAQPSPVTITTKTSLLKTNIDQNTINKITQLHDNSVSVQALFNQARQNPFQE